MEYLSNAFPAMLILAGFFFTLVVGGFVADKVLPKSKRLEEFIGNLPMNWN